MSTENQSSRVTILIAIITLIGTLGTALLANWDKVFPKQASNSQPSPSVASPVSPSIQPSNLSPSSPLSISTTSAPSSSTSSPLPEQGLQSLEHIFIGTWEAQVPDNRWQMKVIWNSQANRYEGTLVKQGRRSLYAGFSLGELCWIATLFDEHTMNVQQKYRSGSNGVSTGFQWASGEVDLDQNTTDTFTMVVPSVSADSNVTFSRVR